MAQFINELGDFNKIREEINNWTLSSVSKDRADPMEMVKLSSGYAVEQFQWLSYHKALGMIEDKDLQKLCTRIGFQEEEHLSRLGSVVDPNMTPMESALALQMTAIQAFSEAGQLETNDICKSTYDYILLDHLTQMKLLSDSASRMGAEGGVISRIMESFGAGAAPKMGARPEEITKGAIQIREGRPIEKQFIPTDDIIKQSLSKDTVPVESFVNVHTVLANDVQLRDEYHLFRRMMPSEDSRRLLNIVTAIENIHVAMLESLMDPKTSPLEYLMINELMEIKTHRQGIQFAKSDSARSAHEYALREDEQHLNWLRDAYSSYGSPAKFKATDKLFALPQMSINEYVNQIAAAVA